MQWGDKPRCKTCGKNHDGPCIFGGVRCFECREKGHKRNECPKATWNQNRVIPSVEQPRPPFVHPNGDHLRLVLDSRSEMLGSHKQKVEFTA